LKLLLPAVMAIAEQANRMNVIATRRLSWKMIIQSEAAKHSKFVWQVDGNYHDHGSKSQKADRKRKPHTVLPLLDFILTRARAHLFLEGGVTV
jgi:hypothetical protein